MQRELENVFMKHYAPNYMLASEQNIHVSDVTEKGDNSVIPKTEFYQKLIRSSTP